MLTMTEKTFLGLIIVSFAVLAGVVFLPAKSYQVSLVTSPNSDTFYVAAGEPFNITCKGSGDNAEKFSSLQWLDKNGQLITKGIPSTREIEKNSLSLTFIEPRESDGGIYKCTAVYEKKQTLQRTVSIIFYGDKPVFDTYFQDVTARENSHLEIYCGAYGELPITYEWYNQYENKITENSSSSMFVYYTNSSSALVIPTVSLSDEGAYTCAAANSHGMSSKIFQLTVLSTLGNDTSGNKTTNETAFRGASVVNVTATSVRFTFDVTGPVRFIEVQYRRDGVLSPTIYSTQFEYDYGGDDYEIDGLTTAARYQFKFRVLPSNNDWSKSYLVTLLPEKPEVIFRMISDGTVKLEWMFKYEDRLKKTIDRHEISYVEYTMQGGTSWIKGNCSITIQVPECASSVYTIADLSPRTYYEIQLRAHTASGYSKPYTQKIFFP